ncbi:MAG: MFS transporter, partial [Deltaproteobacteria bacterium]|nr:MFS transporter [Deltaproteobacteria bacterium]
SVALAGIGSLVFVPLETARSAIPGLVLLGLGIGLSSSPAQASAMSAIPAEQSGVGAALLATLRYLGGIAGIIVLGFVWSGSPLPDIALVEHQRTLHYFTVSLVLALGCAMVLPKHVPTQSAR